MNCGKFKAFTVRIIILTLAALVFIVPLAFGQETVTIDILTVNDFHGALLEEGKNAGAAKLAAYLKQEKARNPNGTILLSAGDMFQGTAESNMLRGESVLAVMNELRFEAMAIGNHEFDWGIDALNDLSFKAEFPFLTANITNINSPNHLASEPYVIIERNGVKIGVIGLTTPETAAKSKPSIVAGFLFEDLARAVNILVPSMKEQGAEVIVVLGHISSEMAESSLNITGEAAELAGKVREVDAIVSGHTHLLVAGKVNEIPVVQAGYHGRAVGKITLTYSKKDKKVIDSKVDIISLTDIEIVPDSEVGATLNSALKFIEAVKNEKVGVALNDLPHNKYEHSVLGQWVSDELRKNAKADIAFYNGGGLRAGIQRGDITVGRIYQTLPFDNTLVTLEMTGSQIMEVLGHGIYNKNIGMLQYSGIDIVYDASLPARKRLVSVKLLNGEKLDLKKSYKVATIDYLSDGGDGFVMFKDGRKITDTYILTRDILIDAAKSMKTINFKGDGRFRELAAKAAA